VPVEQSQKRILGSLGLLDLGLVVLWLGGYIQFNATSGSARDEVVVLAFVGFALAGGSVLVAWPDPRARRLLGLSLVALAVVVVVLTLTVDGFRFIVD
jgi:hypothetical protein